MSPIVARRDFLKSVAVAPFLATVSNTASAVSNRIPGRLFFTSQGKTAMINADGTGLRYLEFDVPNQATWQPGAFFPDGNRVLILSMEPRRDGPGKPFNEYYHTTPTHIWIHDLTTGSLTEIVNKERLAPFCTPQLLLKNGRMLIQVVRNRVPQSFNVNLDGTDPQPFTQPGEGMPYGLNLSPDGKRVAYHLAASSGYEIRTADVDGKNKVLITKRPGHVFFGPRWSPDGKWLIFQDCIHKNDPGHDWADLILCRADGSELQNVTNDNSLWFAATYGSPENRGGGSNVPTWSKDGSILFCRRLPDSKPAWEYQRNRVDVDHYNRDYKPELAQGGTEIVRMNPKTGNIKRITKSDPPVWDFRHTESPDGKHILFCRAETGQAPAIWIMKSNGKKQKLLTKGLNDLGADHPRWIPDPV